MENYTHTISELPGKILNLPFVFEDVVYMRGESNYTIFTLVNRKQYITSRTLRVYEALLPDTFVRIHKGCIINLAYLESLCNAERVAQLKDGSSIGIARRRWPQVKNMMLKHKLRTMY
ncbi:LytTR family DNA-binding domain-containing protein [Telluribacter sp.]|jgi:two-component system LytT family response regulator|uniref:LytR/AlgR family response regulator transcription factor n=1 Tax=Telluribacter sp. TaxID=1978767 RepID=UPI002E1190CA|nr:LytTR family DNA-binding domain-containing protein [Telluribacter sp.]